MDLKCLQTSYIVYFTSWMGQWNIWSATIELLIYMSIIPSEVYNYTLLAVNKIRIFLKGTVTCGINPPPLSNRVITNPEVATVLSKALFTGDYPALLSALF